MLQVTPKHRIFLAVQRVDFRKGIDALAALCRQRYQLDPLTGHFFLFRNRRGDALKVLVYDGQGHWLCQKRLSTGRFHWPVSSCEVLTLTAAQLSVLLYNGDPVCAHTAAPWRPVDS